MFKPSMAPIYAFFSPVDGFAETIVVVSLAAVIGLAFMNKLTDSFAAALTAISGFGVIHDNCSFFLQRLGSKNKALQKPDTGTPQ